MRILLSAYACEPNKGSEPGMGWHWAVETARLGNEVWVVTRANNKPNIVAGLERVSPMPDLHFLYYDLPAGVCWWKRGERGIHAYYLLWQWGAYRFARAAHAKLRFERVHHITLSKVRQPSFMGRLGIPFVFGPVAGGDRAPLRLRRGYGWRGHLADGVRDFSNVLIRLDPMLSQTFKSAERIAVNSDATRRLIPARYRHKTRVRMPVGSEPPGPKRAVRRDEPGSFRVLYVGRFVDSKGMHLGISAFALLLATAAEARLTLVGQGAAERRWRKLVRKLGISARVDWLPWLDRGELSLVYDEHDVFLFPSLHDSGGMAVLEAMSHGLPVVCFDLGGPGMLVDETCGRVIATERARRAAVIPAIARALALLAKDPGLRKKLAVGAAHQALRYRWPNVVREFERGWTEPRAMRGHVLPPGGGGPDQRR